MKTVLKFDTGADGFLKMIIVLLVGAIILLVLGLYFVFGVLAKDLEKMVDNRTPSGIVGQAS